MKFNPFENRFCRDVRNSLGQAFIKAIEERDVNPFQAITDSYSAASLEAPVEAYIQYRIHCLKNILDHLRIYPAYHNHFFLIAALFWNFELFFEFHEWIEKKWKLAQGNTKKALQALILSAVVYEHLQYGRKTSAKKIASKACRLFQQYASDIPDFFDADMFIISLTQLSTPAPKFDLPGFKTAHFK